MYASSSAEVLERARTVILDDLTCEASDLQESVLFQALPVLGDTQPVSGMQCTRSLKSLSSWHTNP